MIIGSGVFNEEEERLGLDDHQSGSDADQPFPRARTHNGSGWGGFDPGLCCSQPSCVSTRPPSPRSTCSIIQLYLFSRIWLSLNMVGVRYDCSTTLVVSSQRQSSSSATAVFHDVIAISLCRLPRRHFSKIAVAVALAACRDATFARSPTSQLFLVSLLQTASVSGGTCRRPSETAP